MTSGPNCCGHLRKPNVALMKAEVIVPMTCATSLAWMAWKVAFSNRSRVDLEKIGSVRPGVVSKYLYICLDTTPQLLPRIRLITVGAVVAGCVCASKARMKTVQLRLGSMYFFYRKTKKLKVVGSL